MTIKVKSSHSLFNWLGSGGDVQLVCGMKGTDPRHIRMSPSKHIGVELYDLA